MAEQYPQMDGRCGTACAYAARVRQFAEQRGVSFDDAMTELEERLEQVRWKVMPAGPQRRENCGTLDVPAEECRVLRLVQGIASCYGMTAQQYMESAYVDDFFSGVADGRSGTAVAISAAVEAAEEAGAQPTDDKELPGGGSGRKRLRLPAMTKNTRRFVLAFGLTLGGVLLIVAAAGIYRWGYNGAIAEKGTYDAGFAAAMAERGTYQEGYDAAIAEKGTYDDGYTAGFAKGKTEGYEEGYAAGHEDGSSEGYDAGYDSGTSDAAQSADTYAFTLEAGVEPGPDGLQGRGRLMIGTEDMPELTGLSFELHEAEPLQLGGTDVALESLSEEQLSALIERFTTALSGCLEAMPVRQTAE